MTYEVHTPVFEGPFDLLLHLILREQVDLYEVPLARIVDAYLVELDQLRRVAAEARALGPDQPGASSFDLGTATEFLLIAATLIELKARRLLPEDEAVDLDDELSLWEERDLLLARLLECKTFKDAAAELEGFLDAAARSVPRCVGPDERFADLQPDFLAGVNPHALRAAYLRATTPKVQPRVNLEHLPQIRASVMDAIAEVADELRRAGSLSFRELCEGLVDRVEVVVRFLAVLELYKQGHVELEQASSLALLEVQWVSDQDIELAHLVSADTYDG
ncbi:MAG: segregation and condensation protein A [Acidimicrobiales bacterium]